MRKSKRKIKKEFEEFALKEFYRIIKRIRKNEKKLKYIG